MRTKNNRKNARNRARCFARSRRSYCRTSRTGSKWSKSSILCGLSNLWTYLSATSCQPHSNGCLGVLAKQDTNNIKDIFLFILFLYNIYMNISFLYIYIYLFIFIYLYMHLDFFTCMNKDNKGNQKYSAQIHETAVLCNFRVSLRSAVRGNLQLHLMEDTEFHHLSLK